MSGKKISRTKRVAFDLYDRIKSTMGEYCDDWIMVGKRCDTEDKIIIGTTDKGWGELSQSTPTSNNGRKKTR